MSNFKGIKRHNKSVVLFCWILILLGGRPARAGTGFDAFDDLATKVKTPAQTPFVSMICVGEPFQISGMAFAFDGNVVVTASAGIDIVPAHSLC